MLQNDAMMSIIDFMAHGIQIRYLAKSEKYFPTDMQSGYDSALHRIAYEIWQAGSKYSADAIDVTTFILVKSGKSKVTLAGIDTEIHSGSLIIFGYQADVQIEVTEDMEIYVICTGREKKQLLRKYGLQLGDAFELHPVKEEAYDVCEKMLQFALSDLLMKQQICNSYLHLLLRMFNNDKIAKTHSISDGEEIVESVCLYIEANLDTLHDIAPIVRYAGYSKEHLARLFKRHRGATTLKYLRQRQMLMARELIRANGLRLDQVAGHFGFSDSYAFSKAYRKIMKKSPGSEHKPDRP